MNNKLIGWLIMTRFSADSHCILLARTWCGHRDQVRGLFDQSNLLIWIWPWSFLTNETNSLDIGLFWPLFCPIKPTHLILVFFDRSNSLIWPWYFLTMCITYMNIYIWSEIGKLQNCVFAILISIRQRGGRHPQRR